MSLSSSSASPGMGSPAEKLRRTRAELRQQDEANLRFWRRVELIATLLESTAGKDKVLKLSQYGLRVFLDFFKQVQGMLGGSKTAQLFGRDFHVIPGALLRHCSVLSKQISTSRKLFRLGRTIHAWYMVRQLLDEPNVFLQIVGLCSWFWNGVYFICDHTAYLRGIGILRRDPLLRLNKISVVAMQTFLFLFNFRKLALSLAQERHILDELEASRLEQQTGSASGSALDLSSSASVQRKASLREDRSRPRADLSNAIKNAYVGGSIATPEELEGQPEHALMELLQATRSGRLQAIFPEFVKNIGDGVVCYDFGFDLGLPSLFTNTLGLVASLAGIHLEILKARRRRNVLLKTMKPEVLKTSSVIYEERVTNQKKSPARS